MKLSCSYLYTQSGPFSNAVADGHAVAYAIAAGGGDAFAIADTVAARNADAFAFNLDISRDLGTNFFCSCLEQFQLFCQIHLISLKN